MLSILFLSLIPSLTTSEISILLNIAKGRGEWQKFKACEFMREADDGSFYLRCERPKTLESNDQESVIPEAPSATEKHTHATEATNRRAPQVSLFQSVTGAATQESSPSGSANNRFGSERRPVENAVGLISAHRETWRRSNLVSDPPRKIQKAQGGVFSQTNLSEQRRASMTSSTMTRNTRGVFVKSSVNQEIASTTSELRKCKDDSDNKIYGLAKLMSRVSKGGFVSVRCSDSDHFLLAESADGKLELHVSTLVFLKGSERANAEAYDNFGGSYLSLTNKSTSAVGLKPQNGTTPQMVEIDETQIFKHVPDVSDYTITIGGETYNLTIIKK